MRAHLAGTTKPCAPRFLRAVPQLGGKPFLFVTADAQVEDAVYLMKAGYIVKLYALSDLLERIARLIKLQPRTAGDLGTSEAMRQVEMLLRRVADIDSSLLITKEGQRVGSPTRSRRDLWDISRYRTSGAS